MIRKFYAATTDPGAGAATEVISEMTEVNMAEMMAKHGRKSGEGADRLPSLKYRVRRKRKRKNQQKGLRQPQMPNLPNLILPNQQRQNQ